MAAMYESRPGEPIQIQLGGSYAQPAASPHACPEGQLYRHLGWAGDRNSGQPLYQAGGYEQNPQEIIDRFRKLMGEYIADRGVDQFVASQGAGGARAAERLAMQVAEMVST